MHYLSYYESPVGRLTLASDGQAVCGLWLEGQKYYCEKVPEDAVVNDGAAGFAQIRAWLDAYFAGECPPVSSVPLAPKGSVFQRQVWKILLEIPYGSLTTYGDIAKRIQRERGGKATSALAVGGAVGRNPISIIIPCHRVVGSTGSLTGYAGGISRKSWLLEHEGVDMAKLFAPKKGTAL